MQNTEMDWLARARRGDPEAFANLVETYQRPVYNLCYRMLYNASDAEDAAQETFLRAYKSIKRYDENRSFVTWLLAIAAHYCIDQIRKQKMKIVSMEELPSLNMSDGQPNPELSVSRKEEQEQVRALLENLNPTDRAAVVMYYWYDLSYSEVAAALSLTESAVKSRLHRARRNMAQDWNERRSQTTSVQRRHHGQQSPAF